MDIPTVVDYLVENSGLPKRQAETIKRTQFRSFEFLPLAAKKLSQ